MSAAAMALILTILYITRLGVQPKLNYNGRLAGQSMVL
jgi:hypothetical protein